MDLKEVWKDILLELIWCYANTINSLVSQKSPSVTSVVTLLLQAQSAPCVISEKATSHHRLSLQLSGTAVNGSLAFTHGPCMICMLQWDVEMQIHFHKVWQNEKKVIKKSTLVAKQLFWPWMLPWRFSGSSESDVFLSNYTEFSISTVECTTTRSCTANSLLCLFLLSPSQCQ